MLHRQHTLFKTRGIFFVAMTLAIVGLFFAQALLAVAANATGWQIVPSPNRSIKSFSNNTLFGVAALSDSDVWAVGNFLSSNNGAINETLTEHWNGTAWSVVPSPNPSTQGDNLTGVAALSATNAWAVGFFENNAQSALQPIILHWNGTAWSLFPNIPNIGMVVEAITARSATDIWAVGTDAAETTNIALHFNG